MHISPFATALGLLACCVAGGAESVRPAAAQGWTIPLARTLPGRTPAPSLSVSVDPVTQQRPATEGHVAFFLGAMPRGYAGLQARAAAAPGQEVAVIREFLDPSDPWRLGRLAAGGRPCPPNALCLPRTPSYHALVHLAPLGATVLVTGDGDIRHTLVPRPGLLPEDRYRLEGPVHALTWTTVLSCGTTGRLGVHARLLPDTMALDAEERRRALDALAEGLRLHHPDCGGDR